MKKSSKKLRKEKEDHRKEGKKVRMRDIWKKEPKRKIKFECYFPFLFSV
jgi:hypothetical protein